MILNFGSLPFNFSRLSNSNLQDRRVLMQKGRIYVDNSIHKISMSCLSSLPLSVAKMVSTPTSKDRGGEFLPFFYYIKTKYVCPMTNPPLRGLLFLHCPTFESLASTFSKRIIRRTGEEYFQTKKTARIKFEPTKPRGRTSTYGYQW